MAELSANADDAFEPFDQVPDALLSAARAHDPLVQIAAGRVQWRIRWSGGAAVKARAVVQELGQSWRPQIEQENFLPPPELRERLRETLAADDANGQRARRVSAGAIQRLQEARRDPAFTAEEAAAVQSALGLFLSKPSYRSPLPRELDTLPPSYLADVVAASFARLNNEEFELPNGEPGTESDIAEPLNRLRGRFIPDLEPLFAVYLAFSGRALADWIGWLESHDGRDPGWAPFTNLMITWQLASVASWAGIAALLDFLNDRSKAQALRDRHRRAGSGSTPHDHHCASRLATRLLLASSRAPEQEADVLTTSPVLLRPPHPRQARAYSRPLWPPVGGLSLVRALDDLAPAIGRWRCPGNAEDLGLLCFCRILR